MEMQIKTTVRFQLTPVSMDVINNTKINAFEEAEENAPHLVLMGRQISETSMEDSMKVSQKPKNNPTR
jgi:hypothetical protein